MNNASLIRQLDLETACYHKNLLSLLPFSCRNLRVMNSIVSSQSVKTLYAFWIPAKQGEEEAEQDTRPSFTDVGLAESYPSLEVANFSISLEEAQEEASFFQFLKRCPNLTSLGCPMIVDPRGVAKFIQLLESPLVLPSMKELNIGLQPIDNHMFPAEKV